MSIENGMIAGAQDQLEDKQERDKASAARFDAARKHFNKVLEEQGPSGHVKARHSDNTFETESVEAIMLDELTGKRGDLIWQSLVKIAFAAESGVAKQEDASAVFDAVTELYAECFA